MVAPQISRGQGNRKDNWFARLAAISQGIVEDAKQATILIANKPEKVVTLGKRPEEILKGLEQGKVLCLQTEHKGKTKSQCGDNSGPADKHHHSFLGGISRSRAFKKLAKKGAGSLRGIAKKALAKVKKKKIFSLQEKASKKLMSPRTTGGTQNNEAKKECWVKNPRSGGRGRSPAPCRE